MSVPRNFIRTAAPPPDWLEKAWSGAKRRGLDTLTRADIDAEIIAHRRKQDGARLGEPVTHKIRWQNQYSAVRRRPL
jgi:hypothetical protein